MGEIDGGQGQDEMMVTPCEFIVKIQLRFDPMVFIISRKGRATDNMTFNHVGPNCYLIQKLTRHKKKISILGIMILFSN